MESFGIDVGSLAKASRGAAQARRDCHVLGVDGKLAGLVASPIPSSLPLARRSPSCTVWGLKSSWPTGDNEATAKAVASRLRIDEVRAGLRPEDKLTLIAEEQQKGHVAAMAGDGINDAPALAKADVGIAMGTGADVAMESAGLTLLKGDLRGVVRGVKLCARHYAQHQAKSVLRLCLQRAWRADRRGRALPLLWHSALAHHGGCRHEPVIGLGRGQRAPPT